MAFPSVTNTFIESTTAYASSVNQNFLDVINGVSDGTKDIKVNDVTCQGTLALSNALTSRTILPVAGDTYDLGSAAGAWNNVWLNQLNIETALVSGTGHVAYRAVANYVNSDAPNYLDLHAGAQIRLNNPVMVNGSAAISGPLGVAGSAAISGALQVQDSATLSGTLQVAGSATVTGQLNLSADLIPTANSALAVGSSSYRWKEMYAANVYASAAAFDSYNVNAGWNKGLWWDANTRLVISAAGSVELTVNGGSGAVHVNGQAYVDGHLYPQTANSYDLGFSTNTWRNLWLQGVAYHYSNIQMYGHSVLFDAAADHLVSGTSNALNLQGLTAINIGGGGTINLRSGAINTTSGLVTVNSSKGDYDFAVNGNSTVDRIFVDASANNVGILKSTPSQALDVAGTIIGTNIGFRGCAETLASYSSGQFEGYYTGVSTATTHTFYYVSTGKTVTLYLPKNAGGLSTATTMSLPAAQMPAAVVPKNYSASDRPIVFYGPAAMFDDAGASAAGGVMVDADAVMFTKGVSDTGWTNSGAKSVIADMIVTYLRD